MTSGSGSLARREKCNTRDQRDSAGDWRNRHSMRLFARRLDRTNVEYFLLCRIAESAPQNTYQAEYNQDRSKDFAHDQLQCTSKATYERYSNYSISGSTARHVGLAK